ncbi:MAG: ComEC/Rec2 family competence protein [Candidatus Moranbacteria bacterium]|nr:ComEC/Rec2 family competence protein [Candidatus Moranbacteria bacterium]
MLMKDQVFLLACLGYIGGVFAGSFFVVPGWMLFLGAALWGALFVTFPRKNIFLLFFPFGLFLFGTFSVTQSLEHFHEENMRMGEVSGIVRVVSDPEEKSFYNQIIIRMETCESEVCPSEKILWQAPKTVAVVSGARMEFSCALELPENFDPTFDYRMFLAKDNVGYVCRKASSWVTLPEDDRTRFARIFFWPKHAFEEALGKSLPQPEAGLALGLIVGGDNRLPETLKTAFARVGLTHIVAISGYNIALIAQGLLIFGIGIGLWRKQAIFLAALGVIFFVFLVGAPASAVRAGVMGLSVFAAFFVGRLSRGVNMLLLAAVSMLFFQPLLLRYDVGFQLSFLATLGIIVMAPFMDRFLSKEFFGKGFLEIFFLTFAVELFVMPVLMYQFHIFSPWALLTNVLLLPLVPYAMALGFVSAVAFFILPGLHMLPATLTYFFLWVITYVVERFGALPSATIEVSLGGVALLAWYVLLFFGIVIMKKQLRRKYVQTKDLS